MDIFLILADDLTGAADTASRCRAAGLPAMIFLALPRPPLPAGVVAFTSDSRHLPPEEAGRRVREAATPLAHVDARWYKKIDSTLRGNIGRELDTLLDLLDASGALVCPAFPAQGRGLVNGHLVAPGLPPPSVHLPSLLRAQSRCPVESFSLADVRSGELAERIQRKDAEGQRRRGEKAERRLLVVDALVDEDLAAIVDAATALPGLLLCGSAGLIGEVAKRYGPRIGQPGPPQSSRPVERTLVVVGSGSEMAHRQIDRLLAAHPDTQRLVVEPGEAASVVSQQAARTLIHQSLPAPDAVLDGPEARRRVAFLADAALAQIEQNQPDLLLLAGGDTAVAVLSRLGVERLVVQAELLPGMPLCAADINGHDRGVVMKPGSFGEEDTLIRLLRLAGG